MKVKNVKGTTDRACKCASWLEHWKRFSKRTATTCKAKGCPNKKSIGAHVKKIGGGDTEYIVPFCQAHNQQSEPIWIALRKGTKPAPANKNKTCK